MERITIENLPDGTKKLIERAAKSEKLFKLNGKPNVMAMSRVLILKGLMK